MQEPAGKITSTTGLGMEENGTGISLISALTGSNLFLCYFFLAEILVCWVGGGSWAGPLETHEKYLRRRRSEIAPAPRTVSVQRERAC